LSEAVLKLQETGELTRMKTKWWKEKRGGGKCDVDSYFTFKHKYKLIFLQNVVKDETKELTIAHVSGVFLVLIVGCAYGVLEGIMRWIINIKKLSNATKVKNKIIMFEKMLI
jgi:glutamate receptor, ionotropic, invertebrate